MRIMFYIITIMYVFVDCQYAVSAGRMTNVNQVVNISGSNIISKTNGAPCLVMSKGNSSDISVQNGNSLTIGEIENNGNTIDNIDNVVELKDSTIVSSGVTAKIGSVKYE